MDKILIQAWTTYCIQDANQSLKYLRTSTKYIPTINSHKIRSTNMQSGAMLYFTHVLVCRSHTLIVHSTAALEKSWNISGSGWNCTKWTTPLDPRKLCVQYCFSTSHTFTVLSLEPIQKNMKFTTFPENFRINQVAHEERSLTSFHAIHYERCSEEHKSINLAFTLSKRNYVCIC